MPLYEYTCRKCHSDFELLIRGEETAECLKCQSHNLEKHLSVTAAPTVSGSGPLPMCGMPSMAACGQPECGKGCCAFQ